MCGEEIARMGEGDCGSKYLTRETVPDRAHQSEKRARMDRWIGRGTKERRCREKGVHRWMNELTEIAFGSISARLCIHTIQTADF